MVNKKRLIKLTQDLIRIDSQNPPGDETKIVGFLKDYLTGIGLRVKIWEFKKARPNIVTVLKGENAESSLLITPHLDTVPCGRGWRDNPFGANLKNGKIFGLGATDCKGNLACGIEAINSIIEDKFSLSYDLIFAATSDEENGSQAGLIPLLDKGILKPDAAVVLDSDEFNIIITQKGLIHLKVKIFGKKAHGAYPWRGINAIGIGCGIIQELEDTGFKYKKSEYLRYPTVNVGTIRGGDRVNIVADWCEFELDFRFLPGMSEKKIIAQLKAIINKFTKSAKIEIQGIQAPYFIKETHSLVTCLKKSIENFNIEPQIKGSEAATVITFFQHKKIPAIATGFGSAGCAHVANEFAKIDNLYKGAAVLDNFLRRYHGGN